MNKLFAIGDIHGCIDTFNKLLDTVPIDFSDTVVFLGDYIDRGPNSKAVIEKLIELKSKHNGIICLRGNHEQMLIDASLYGFYGYSFELWIYNGGGNTLKSYSDLDPYQNHIDFIKEMKFYYKTDSYIFVHAGLKPRIELNDQIKDDMLWIRRDFIDSEYDFGKYVIFGHTPSKKVCADPYKACIDTGCVYSQYGNLTCVELGKEGIENIYSIPNCEGK